MFRNTQISLIATPQLALQGAVNQANKFGINALVLGDAIEGEAREVARVHASNTSQVLRHNQPAPAPVVLLSGGETTVKVKALAEVDAIQISSCIRHHTFRTIKTTPSTRICYCLRH